MKDSEFLELLNLYLDHEITPAEAARLEIEIQKDPKRRATYREYCRIQKACTLLVSEFQTAEAPSRGKDTSERVTSFADVAQVTPRRRVGRFIGTAALAAACLALVFTAGRKLAERSHSTPSSEVGFGSDKVAQAPGPKQPTAVSGGTAGPRSFAATNRAPERDSTVRLSLVGESLVLSGSARHEATVATTPRVSNDQLDWVRNFQLVSLRERSQMDQLRFEAVPASMRPEGHSLGTGSPTEAAVEMTAFRFVK